MNYKFLPFDEALNARHIRQKVFIEEQGFMNEFDEIDRQALHLELYDNDQCIGCARLYTYDNKTYILGRIALLKPYRGRHLGCQLISILEAKCKELKAQRIELSAQVRASGFYEKCGYVKVGQEYLDEYCPHIKMVKDLIDEPKNQTK